jgi:hypothetical protein
MECRAHRGGSALTQLVRIMSPKEEAAEFDAADVPLQ